MSANLENFLAAVAGVLLLTAAPMAWALGWIGGR